MSNQLKVEVKVGVYKSEIEEIGKQIKGADENRLSWLGYNRAYLEMKDLYQSLFNTIKKAMDWESLTGKERKKLLIKNPKAKPNMEMTHEEGVKCAELIRPLETIIGNKILKATSEPIKFAAQTSLLERNIERLQKLIAYEISKDTSEDFEEDLDDDAIADKEINEIEEAKKRRDKK